MKCPICGTKNNYYFEKCVKCGFILNFDEETEEELFEKTETPIFLCKETCEKNKKKNRFKKMISIKKRL